LGDLDFLRETMQISMGDGPHLGSEEATAAAAAQALGDGEPIPVWLDADTGMNPLQLHGRGIDRLV
jgi:alanine racemase